MKTAMTVLLTAICGLSHALATDAVTPEQKLAQLGLALKPVKALGNYVPAVRTGNLVFLSGQIPRGADGKVLTGKVGRNATVAQATEAARASTVQLLSALKAEVGDLSKVKRIVRVVGFVNCTDDFTDEPKVINGCSDLLVAVLGDKGRHARAAVGAVSLPLGAAVEIEMVAEVSD
jgi:enamine deaminase RidA (YjgF/YER057c/UK114 family)